MIQQTPYRTFLTAVTAAWVLFLTSCDAVVPAHEEAIVVEAWLDTGRELPSIRISSTNALGSPLSASPLQSPARVELDVAGSLVSYQPDAVDPLRYVPQPGTSVRPQAGNRFELHVEHEGRESTALGRMPPMIRLKDISVLAASEPTPVVLLDSLNLGLDSLALDVNATTGFIYPIQVSVSWEDNGEDDWIEARLRPSSEFSSSLIDFFLLPSQVFPESSAEQRAGGVRTWQGVYALPVSEADTPLPEHSLHVILIRGDDRFAQFATSRTTPERREPISNVNGGLGFVGGISVDSTSISVNH